MGKSLPDDKTPLFSSLSRPNSSLDRGCYAPMRLFCSRAFEMLEEMPTIRDPLINQVRSVMNRGQLLSYHELGPTSGTVGCFR